MKKLLPAKKSLGQNFLGDPFVRQKMIAAAELKADETVLEIGPGRGFLTDELIKSVKNVIAVETDTDLIPHLQNAYANKNLRLIHHDILSFPFENLPNRIKIVSNLPYNIATPIIEKVIANREKFYDFFMTVQLEYGQRLCAKPNSKDYGSLSIFVQYYGQTKLLFRIKETAFYPRPKIQSCFVRFTPYKTLPYKAQEETLLFEITRAAFGQRRKTISNSLSQIIPKADLKEVLSRLKIKDTARAENLAVKDFVDVSNAWANLRRI